MSDKAKIGAAVAGGYLLGRTKRGRLALGLALLLAGYRPSTQLRKGLLQLADNPEIGKLTSQLRGPLGVAGRKAAEAVIAAQATKLTENLARRTEALSDQIKDAGQTGRDTAERAGDTAGGAVRGVSRRARGADADTDEEGAEQEKPAPASRRRRNGARAEEPEPAQDEDEEPDEEDRYEDEEDDEDVEPARPKASVGSRRRSS